MNIFLRLSAVTKIAETINHLEVDIFEERGSDGKILQKLRDTIFEIIQKIYDQQETQEERDEVVKQATKAIKDAGWVKFKYNIIRDKFYLVPDKDTWN